jgi:hypothetical protein
MKKQANVKAKPDQVAVAENLEVLNRAVEKAIQNIVTQAEVNRAIVRRLLAVEQKVAELEARTSQPQPVRTIASSGN